MQIAYSRPFWRPADLIDGSAHDRPHWRQAHKSADPYGRRDDAHCARQVQTLQIGRPQVARIDKRYGNNKRECRIQVSFIEPVRLSQGKVTVVAAKPICGGPAE